MTAQLTGSKKNVVLAFRLTATEAAAVKLISKTAGKTPSEWLRDLLVQERHRTRPTLAAAGELLGICHRLLAASADLGRDTIEEDVRACVNEVFRIVELHEHGRPAR